TGGHPFRVPARRAGRAEMILCRFSEGSTARCTAITPGPDRFSVEPAQALAILHGESRLAPWRLVMNTRLLQSVPLVAGVLLAWTASSAQDAKKDEAVKKELQKFEGTWIMVSAERNGEKSPEEAIKGFRVIIKGDKVTFKAGDQMIEGTLTVDPTRKP